MLGTFINYGPHASRKGLLTVNHADKKIGGGYTKY